MRKKLILAMFTLAVVLVGHSVDAQVANFTRNLTVGSQGADVAQLQTWLISRGYHIPAINNGTAVPGYFGSQTKAALTAYQAANGIPNTGFFGPMTMAVVNAQIAANVGGGGGIVNCPPGYNCTPIVTTPVCPVGFICTPIGGGTVVGNNGLRGDAGDITVTERSSGTDDEVMEGDREIPVLGFEIEAQGSDVAINSVRVELRHAGDGSNRLDRYASRVLIMHDDDVVGTANVADFSESSNVYSRNIPVSNVVVREGERERLYVAVTALNNIDSDDIGEDWVVGVGQIRFEDATGVVLTDTTGDGVSGGDNGPISSTFTFEDLSSSGGVRLRVTEDDSTINRARVVQVSDSGDTNDVNILSFNLDAEGSDIYLERISFDITSNGSGVTEIINDFRLMMGNDEIGRVTIDRDCDGGNDGFGSNADTSICVVVDNIDDDDVVIERDEEESFMLVVDINEAGGNFSSGDTVMVSLDSDDIEAENENGNSIDESDLTGTVSTEEIQFLSSGVSVRVINTPNPTYITGGDSASDDRGQFVMEFEVEAIEDTVWIELTADNSTDAEADGVGVAYIVENASTNSAAIGGSTSAVLSRISGGTQTGNFVRINSGQTARFRLTATYDPTSAGFYRIQMLEIGYNQNSASDANAAQTLAPESDYQSSAMNILN